MNLRERFEAKVSPEPTSGCHLWTAATDGHGYGVISRGRHEEGMEKAHRLAWILAYGPVPEGLCVLHRCDVRACVSVHHLFLGDHGSNARDRESKGRGRNQHLGKTHCSKGHRLAGENLYPRRDGARECRACMAVRQARYYARRKR